MPPSPMIFLIVGSASRMRRSSVICCLSSSGTLKSTRSSTFCAAEIDITYADFIHRYLLILTYIMRSISTMRQENAHSLSYHAEHLDHIAVADGHQAVVHGTMRIADDIGRHNRIIAILQRPSKRVGGGRFLESRIDLLDSGFFFENDGQIHQRCVRSGHANRADHRAFPSSRECTSAIALAAPVVVGTIDIAAERARRRSLCGASIRRWSAVYEWMVVMNPFTIPKLSRSTLATGARQLVVHEPIEMIWCLDLS